MTATDTNTTVTLTVKARKIIASDVTAEGRAAIRYRDYVAEMAVTLDTLPAHVAAFRDAFRRANPDADGKAVKAYATKVRNGLGTYVPGAPTHKPTREKDYVQALVTAVNNAHAADKGALTADEIVDIVRAALDA